MATKDKRFIISGTVRIKERIHCPTKKLFLYHFPLIVVQLHDHGAKKSIVVVSLSNSSDRRRSPAGRGMVKARQVKDDIEKRTKPSQHIGGHYFSLSLLSLVPLLWSTEQLACMQVDLANR